MKMNVGNDSFQSTCQDELLQLSYHLPPIHPGLIGLPFLHLPPRLLPELSPLFLAGFTDCAEEAIRYLETEGLSPEDPILVGLKQHLYEKQSLLEHSIMLQNTFHCNSLYTSSAKKQEPNIKFDMSNSEKDYSLETTTVELTADEINIGPCLQSAVSGNICSDADNIHKKLAELVNEVFLLLEEEGDIYQESDSDVDEGFDEITEQEVIL